ncbi:hypothetical protein NMY22_g14064 [Coprinellus aureogranulatus]|nr:hypothetical protein NMY22_g14064 [Coprinellus aureogranulatus]
MLDFRVDAHFPYKRSRARCSSVSRDVICLSFSVEGAPACLATLGKRLWAMTDNVTHSGILREQLLKRSSGEKGSGVRGVRFSGKVKVKRSAVPFKFTIAIKNDGNFHFRGYPSRGARPSNVQWDSTAIMLRVIKPKNARSKRALDAREPKEVEDPRTVIFVKGTHTGEVLNGVFKDLMALKRPHAISFSKKNEIHPFDSTSPSNAPTSSTGASSSSVQSLEFWSAKNDASMFVIGQTTKKRPNGMTFVRMFDGRVLDMIEVGVEGYKPMSEFKTPKSTPGNKPLIHFASELFDTHPRFIHLKSMLVDFFNGEEVDSISLLGLDHVISVSLSPTPSTLNEATSLLPSTYSADSVQANPLAAVASASYLASTVPTIGSNNASSANLPKVHIRTYTTKLLSSGVRTPRVELVPMGPSLDLVLRRYQAPDSDMLKLAMKRPKLKKQDVESGLGKKRKNLEVDEMGDLRGRVHVGVQDLSKLKGRKMKGLQEDRPGKRQRFGDDSDGDTE